MRRNLWHRSATVPAVGALLLAIGTHTGQEPLAAAENPRWELLVTNLDVFPGTEKLFDPDDELFWRLRPNLRGVKASERLPGAVYPFSVSTDSDRRRRTPKVKSPDKTSLFLGDSCTFGIPVDDDESLPWRVQQRLTKSHAMKIRAINAAVPGYSAFQGRLVLEQWKEKPAPDAVVITFWPNGRNIWDHLSDAEHKELLAAEREGGVQPPSADASAAKSHAGKASAPQRRGVRRRDPRHGRVVPLAWRDSDRAGLAASEPGVGRPADRAATGPAACWQGTGSHCRRSGAAVSITARPLCGQYPSDETGLCSGVRNAGAHLGEGTRS